MPARQELEFILEADDESSERMMIRTRARAYCRYRRDEKVYPAKVTELKRLSPHASVDVKRVPVLAAPAVR